MRFAALCCLFLFLSASHLAADQIPAEPLQPVTLEFGGYRFGQSPAANMTCLTGFCKSQAPGGDGRIDYPFSIYETPGTVSTLAGLMIVRPRYLFWDDRLYRVTFQVDCTPLEMAECLDDTVHVLDREYSLTPLSARDFRQFAEEKHFITREFKTDSGAFITLRINQLKDLQAMPLVDIVDKGMAEMVASTLSSAYQPKKPEVFDPVDNP